MPLLPLHFLQTTTNGKNWIKIAVRGTKSLKAQKAPAQMKVMKLVLPDTGKPTNSKNFLLARYDTMRMVKMFNSTA